ncbi:translation initiation factor IF-5A [Candidatus Bathyarchaeota archaeon]|nr:translation initiation factor IF-5A [Candidatus Bathyarchaeota archaeon]
MSITRKDANQLKKGNYFLLDGKVHKVISDPQHSKSGKHGHAKIRVNSINIFTDKKSSSTFPASQSIDIPNIDKRNAQITHITEDSIGLMDNESFQSFEVAIPDDDELKGKLAEGLNVEYWIVMDKKIIQRIV